MPITFTGLQALSVVTPTTVSTAELLLADRADEVLGAEDVRLDRLERLVLAGRDLLQRGRVEDDVGTAQRGGQRGEVADVPDAEVQAAVLAVEHVVGGDRAVLEVQAHRVLLGLVA